jgi:AcrR family transcriptional regulator
MTADALPSVDGRRARRDQNRERVVDALLEIYREGNLRPSVAEVAERSGVSHRSVFRYFEDLDELYRVAVERQMRSIFDHLVLSGIGDGTLDERIDAIIENRQEIHDVAANVFRVGQTLAPVEPVIAEHHADMARRAVEQIRQHFAPELERLDPAARAPLTEAVAVALSMESLGYLRGIRGMDRAESTAAVRATLRGLLADGRDFEEAAR